MLIKKYTSVILIIFLPLILNAQEIINPLTPQPESEEFRRYINMIDDNNITTIRFKPKNSSSTNIKEMHQDSVKKLVALAIFSRLYNPLEFIGKQRELVKQVKESKGKFFKHYLAAVDLFSDKQQYNNFQHKYKHILFDLYFSPYVLAGTITNIDTIYKNPPVTYPIIKYEMIISDNINSYYKEDVINKKFIFLFSSGHWATFDPFHGPHSWITPKEVLYGEIPEQKFIIGKEYIIFIYNSILNFSGTKKDEKGLPALNLTAYENLNFPIEQSYVIDTQRYFGKEEKVKLSDVKNIIDSIFDELSSWKE